MSGGFCVTPGNPNARRRALSLLLLAFILTVPARAVAAEDEPIPWIENPQIAFKAAAESGKPVFVDIWAVWCMPCKAMDAGTYRNPKVVEWMREYVPLKVDADAQTIFVESYAVEAYPTILFLDPKGNVLARRSGYLDSSRMATALEEVRDGYPEYLAAREAAEEDPTAARRVGAYLVRVGNHEGAVDYLKRAIRDVPAGAPGLKEWMELDVAKAMAAGGDASGAVGRCRKLATVAADRDVRAGALVVIVRAERERGRDDKAAEALATLRSGWPDVASAEFGASASGGAAASAGGQREGQ